MNGLSGFALAGYLKDLDRKREKGLNALQQLRESQKHAELSGLADFDLMERARELGLTGEFSQVPEVQAFLSEPIETRMKQQNLETGDLALQSAKSKAEREQRAGEALNKTLSDIRLQDTLGQIDFSQGLKDQGFQTNPKSNRDIAMENLTPYMDDARVQGFVSSFIERPENLDIQKKRLAMDEKEYNLRVRKLEKELSTIGENGLDPEKIATIEGTLRKEFIGLNKDFYSVRDAYSRIAATAKNPSAAGDLALIFNYMKMLDPNSVVREGEFANAQNAGSVPNKIIGVYNRVLNGERLADAQRKDFLNQAQRLYSTALETYKKTAANYMGLAVQYGGQPSRVVTDMTADVEPNQGTLQNFTSVQEAEAANLPKGTIITINGRKAVVE